ncbi:MAG: 30S ribosomal protein S9 [Parachlamydiales bacterium]|nr:30S ribosomal protein S9 [Parachlamydiales bacterium]
MKEFIGVGRRKTAVASVRLRKGKGQVLVNGEEFSKYFPLTFQQSVILSPLVKLELDDTYDMLITAKGGGIEAQTEAIRLGISRALVQDNEDYRGKLKELGYLTRDPRKKERKKYGLAGARKRFQFSKR